MTLSADARDDLALILAGLPADARQAVIVRLNAALGGYCSRRSDVTLDTVRDVYRRLLAAVDAVVDASSRTSDGPMPDELRDYLACSTDFGDWLDGAPAVAADLRGRLYRTQRTRGRTRDDARWYLARTTARALAYVGLPITTTADGPLAHALQVVLGEADRLDGREPAMRDNVTRYLQALARDARQSCL